MHHKVWHNLQFECVISHLGWYLGWQLVPKTSKRNTMALPFNIQACNKHWTHQDGWKHVQVGDWPKLSGVWFLLQISILNHRALVAIAVVFNNGCHPKANNMSSEKRWSSKVSSMQTEFFSFSKFSECSDVWFNQILHRLKQISK